MHKVHTMEYSTIIPLFQNMNYHLAVHAVLNKIISANIYVDNITSPCAALIQVKNRFYLAGSHSNSFNNSIKEILVHYIYSGQTKNNIAILYYTPPWGSILGILLKNQFPVKAYRHYYTFDHLVCNWKNICPEKFSIRLVTRSLLNTPLKNLDNLKKEMCSERKSVEDFLENSFGICAVYKNKIAGWCLSEYNTETQCEIGIETLKPFQKQGVATSTASACIEYALSQNISHIGWHCYKNNISSIKTAKKVGFKKDREYPVYIIGR